MNDAVVVATVKSLRHMLEIGGSGYWKANGERVEKCKYVVATCKGHSSWANDREAFLVGKISEVVAIPSRDGKLLIRFSEYATISVPNAWKGQRNPVSYTSLSALRLKQEELKWTAVPDYDKPPLEPRECGLTIEQAKAGIAALLGISADCIEITIKA